MEREIQNIEFIINCSIEQNFGGGGRMSTLREEKKSLIKEIHRIEDEHKESLCVEESVTIAKPKL